MPSKLTPLRRDQLELIAGKRHEIIRWLENLQTGVIDDLPEDTTAALELATAASLGVFGRRPAQQAPSRVTPGLITTQDAAGQILELDFGLLALLIRSASPRQAPERLVDDAQQHIANHVFARR